MVCIVDYKIGWCRFREKKYKLILFYFILFFHFFIRADFSCSCELLIIYHTINISTSAEVVGFEVIVTVILDKVNTLRTQRQLSNAIDNGIVIELIWKQGCFDMSLLAAHATCKCGFELIKVWVENNFVLA